MPALRCRRSITTDMAVTQTKLSVGSPRKTPTAKRKLLGDDMSQSPAKRTRSKTNPETNLSALTGSQTSDSNLTPPERMQPKSFYGGARGYYVSPLERKEQRENSFISPTPPPVQAIVKYASPLVGKASRKNIIKKAKRTVKQKSFKQKERNIVLQSPTAADQSLDTSITEKENKDEDVESVTDSVDNKPKRFFKHRTSPGEEAKARGSRVVLRKGFQLTYHRAPNGMLTGRNDETVPSKPDTGKSTDKNSMMLASLSTIRQSRDRRADDVKTSNPHSQDMFSDTSDYSAWFEDEDTGSVIDSNKRITRSQSPIKKYASESPCPSPLRERNTYESVVISEMSSSADSAMADSVMLMSELSSIKSASITSGTPKGSPFNQKRLFPIFSSKASPGSKPIKSASTTSSPHSSAPNSPYQPTSTTRSSRHVLRALRDRDGKEQMILDFGQKLGTATQCSTCGMTYTEGEPSDEATHSKFHQNILHTLKFSGWKKERICQNNPDGSRVVVVISEDKFATKKVEAVRNIVDTELGFVVERRKLVSGMKTYLYISEEKQIIGCCIAQEIKKGYRVLTENATEGSQQPAGRPWCCSMTPEPVKCGISRIWVLASHRGRNIATQLLDCVRFDFMLGYPLKKEELAFSDPTPDGRSFATSYTNTPCFLVYKVDNMTASQ